VSQAWAIKDWDTVFEDHRSREVVRLAFLHARVLDRKSDAYAMLVAQEGGIEAYGVFWALVLVAARCPVRGVLADDKGVLTPLRMSIKAGIPLAPVERAIPMLSAPEIGWLVVRAAGGATTDCRPGADAPPTGCRRGDDETTQTADGLPKSADEVPTKPHLGAERARNSTQQHTTATATATGDTTKPPNAAAAAAAAVGLSCEEIESRAAYLSRKPSWLGESKRWLSPAAVREFAGDVRVTEAVVAEAYAEGKAARTLSNPAGVVIKHIRQAVQGVSR